MTFDHRIIGTADKDMLDDAAFLPSESVLIRGLGGSDRITSTGTLNRIDGGGGNDAIHANGGVIWGGAGFDHIFGTDAFEVVNPGADGGIVDIAAHGRILGGAGWGDFRGSTASTDIDETVSYVHSLQDYLIEFSATEPDKVMWGGGTDTLTSIDRILTSNGTDQVTGSGKTYVELVTRGGDDYIDFSGDVIKVDAGRGNDTLVLKGHTNTEATIDMDTGTDRVFCGDGAETITIRPGGAAHLERAFLYIEDFAAGTDKIDLQSRMTVAHFLSLGHESNWSSIDGLRFDTASGDTLFLKGFTSGQLTADDFLV